MKRKTEFLTVFLVLVLVAMSYMPVVAGPPPMLPSSFFGIVKKNGANMPAGTVVSAWINGVQVAHTTVVPFNGDTVYSLDVPADNTDTTVRDGGTSGDTVVFYVGNQTQLRTGVWHSGVNVQLNLTLFQTYLPVVARNAGN
jgi:hypothetical protein